MENVLISKAAKIVGCHPETLRRLDRKGQLKSARDYRGYRTFRLEDLLRLKESREKLDQ
jgi:DNA-binding transcriptional MerR regulator